MIFFDSVYRANVTQQAIFNNTIHVQLVTNDHWDRDLPNVPPAQSPGCFFKALFKGSHAVQERVKALSVQLFGSFPAAYNAWHWRTGGADGKPDPSDVYLQERIASAAMCFTRMQQVHGTSSAPVPVLLVTDSKAARRWAWVWAGEGRPSAHRSRRSNSARATEGGVLGGAMPARPMPNVPCRRLVRAGQAPGFVAANLTSIHVDNHPRYPDGSPEYTALLSQLMDTFAELYLLGHGQCVMASRSGFSNTALWWGSTQCNNLWSGESC